MTLIQYGVLFSNAAHVVVVGRGSRVEAFHFGMAAVAGRPELSYKVMWRPAGGAWLKVGAEIS